MIVLYIVLTLAIAYLITTLIFARKVICIRRKTDAQIEQYRADGNWYDPAWYQALPKEELRIRSDFGYDLSATYIPHPNDQQRTVIICHGVTVNRFCVLKYARMFIDRGYHVLLYDHRAHGQSGGKYITYGYYEKHDLATVVHWVESRNPDGLIGLIGESMGAAIVMQYAGMSDKLAFIIPDCGFTSLPDEMAHQLQRMVNLPAWTLMWGTRKWIQLLARFNIHEVSPVNAVQNIHIPTLFIHGDSDDYVPTHMVYPLMEACASKTKQLYIAKDARHAVAWDSDPAAYEQQVHQFLRSNDLPTAKV